MTVALTQPLRVKNGAMNADIERIKQIPIADLIGQSYTVTGKGHTLTTAEHDSLMIDTRANLFTWFSQEGANGKPLGGSPIDWYMYNHRCDTGTAIKELATMLDGGAITPQPRPRVERKPADWKSPAWQAKARRDLAVAQDALWNLPEGKPGREYLESRGFRVETGIAFDLGYGAAWNDKAGRMMPALWLPWMNREITALKYRFIGVGKDDADALRFSQKGGSVPYLFGLQRRIEGNNSLILVEGELNAVSIFQAAYGALSVDAVSFGPQGNLQKTDVMNYAAKLAERYERVIVWADESEIAAAARGFIPGVKAIRSPNGMDANDLLQAELLGDFIAKLTS
ncbi:MAG: hypothetical protein R2932_09950 [Caldilineaceae bacterium]